MTFEQAIHITEIKIYSFLMLSHAKITDAAVTMYQYISEYEKLTKNSLRSIGKKRKKISETYSFEYTIIAALTTPNHSLMVLFPTMSCKRLTDVYIKRKMRSR